MGVHWGCLRVGHLPPLSALERAAVRSHAPPALRCGKSSVGRYVADFLQCPFLDADDYHTKANVDKMAQGIPLADEDRWPWLHRLAGVVDQHLSSGLVLACSALKASYRAALAASPSVGFIYLKASKDLLSERLSMRQDHFMGASMVDSQLSALEEPVEGVEGRRVVMVELRRGEGVEETVWRIVPSLSVG
ncbi:unnamed protein product [Vitrella brassicaformis CCMP3155]|uniref:Gluconokinase n=1 Tax=Vitrella brassicaformis (strain CCMP3155) TaxID=1169540 RepID=A0A0G4EWY4_VITBC|nr:unnamed protein product [Vitrella brassicaformis CCMP3155]|eukprot:CEM03502.1 unnamed protein product [Vitrella brassicaformis CCMP3155]